MRHILLAALMSGLLGFAGVSQAAGDAAAGKAKAESCAMCHGPLGQGTQVGKKIAGMDQAAFIQALKDFASGKRENAMMKVQAGPLSVTDQANLAAYYATLK